MGSCFGGLLLCVAKGVLDRVDLRDRGNFEIWRGARAVEWTCLENKRGETYPGFESLPLRKDTKASS